MKYNLQQVKQALETNAKEFRKNYGISKTEYLINIPPEYINQLSKNDLFKLTKTLSIPTLSRRKKVEDFLEETNVPTANIFREGHKVNYTEEKLSPKNDMSIQKLRNLFLKQRNFLQAKSSTVEGIKEILDNFYTRIKRGLSEVSNIKGDIDLNEIEELDNEQYKKLWNLYNKVENRYTGSGFDSNQIQSMVYEVVRNYGEYNTIDELVEIMEEEYSPEYLYETKKDNELEDDLFTTTFGR